MQECNWEFFKEFISSTELPWIYVVETDGSYSAFVSHQNITIKCYLRNPSADLTEFEASYKELGNQNALDKSSPFSKPSYRTKKDATASWVTCLENVPTVLDFQLTAERYASGGEIIFKNTKEGDYITAEVFDTDSVIPEPYRAALCEAWPSVAKYIVKKWIVPTEVDGYGSFVIDTYPLNAKISAGLYLRVTYHASAVVGDRKCAVNYHLTQKL